MQVVCKTCFDCPECTPDCCVDCYQDGLMWYCECVGCENCNEDYHSGEEE